MIAHDHLNIEETTQKGKNFSPRSDVEVACTRALYVLNKS